MSEAWQDQPSSAHPLDVLASPARRDIFDTLANLPHVATDDAPATRAEGLTASALAQRLNLHVTTIRFHVDQLIAAGLVDGHDDRSGVGRPRRHYTVSPGQLAEVNPPDVYKLLAHVLAEAMASGDSPTAEEAGRRWVLRHADENRELAGTHDPAQTPGAWLGKLGILVDVLDQWGYAPEISTTNSGHTAEVALRHCPMRELAASNPAVACGIHRGIIQGTLEAIGESDSEVSLVPFVEPSLCVARITTRAQFNRPERP